MNFFGTTTAISSLASVASGVQTTGTALWPFLVLIGVPLAFVIGSMLISFIKGTVGQTNNLATDEATVAHDLEIARIKHELDTYGHSRL